MTRIVTGGKGQKLVSKATYEPVKVYMYNGKGEFVLEYTDETLSSYIQSYRKSQAPGPCYHYKVLEPETGLRAIKHDKTEVHVVANGGYYAPIVDSSLLDYAFAGSQHSLNWKKLSSSNEAGLLQNLAELDDTVAMMSTGILKSASYGGYQWGWKPLIADSLAVIDTIQKCAKYPPGAPQPYADTNKITKKIVVGGPEEFTYTELTVTQIVKLEGTVTVPLDILSYYDFLGFHPKPSLYWDLVPLSFAIDWFLPIGDMIAKLDPPEGWVKSVNFTGWKMTTLEISEFNHHHNNYSPLNGCRKYKKFWREHVSNIALEQKTVVKSPRPPFSHSLANVADAAYLAKTFMGDYGPWAKKRKEIPHIDWRKRRSGI